MNIASLGLHKEELEDLFSILDIEFDVIGLTETKIEKDITPIYDISLNGYKCFHTRTESKKGCALLYIKENINCKPRNDLAKEGYKVGKLESIFLEIINKGKKNSIIGCIYRHPSMDIDDFNGNVFEPIMERMSNDNKEVISMGDFNIDLMKIEDDNHINEFYNIIRTNFFVPHIALFPPELHQPQKHSLIIYSLIL